MTQHFEKWLSQAQKITFPKPTSVPIHVLIGESVEVASAFIKYWEPRGCRPGLNSAGRKITRQLADDIISLHHALQDAQGACQITVDKRSQHEDLINKAETVLDDLTAALEWYFDDGIGDTWDDKLKDLAKTHTQETRSVVDLEQALYDYASLARPLASKLEGVGGFDVTDIGNAFSLSRALHDVRQCSTDSGDPLATVQLVRDQLAQLLMQHVRLARSAARFVFRKQPELVGEFTSSYKCPSRAIAQRRATQEGERLERNRIALTQPSTVALHL